MSQRHCQSRHEGIKIFMSIVYLPNRQKKPQYVNIDVNVQSTALRKQREMIILNESIIIS